MGDGIIDEGYGGNIGVVMFNFCKEKFEKERWLNCTAHLWIDSLPRNRGISNFK